MVHRWECGRFDPIYDNALAPLGYQRLSQTDFWISEGRRNESRLHIAFRAESRAQVDEFYRAALAAGGKDNGKPGLRPGYHENYYGGFVLDPSDHNIEAVCHALPE